MTNSYRYLLVLVAGVFFLVSTSSFALAVTDKQVVGETARIKILETDFDFLARIDTGARITSLHAVDIVIQDASEHERDNVGKQITFVTRNNRNMRKILCGEIVDVALVKNAQGREYRYVIELSLQWQGKTKKVQVNLRDRARMTYKLLIGRNWLANDYVVDVDLKED